MSPSNLFYALFVLVLLAASAQADEGVKYRVIDRTGYITGCNRYETEIGNFYTRQVMGAASSFIWRTFNQSYFERRNFKDVTLMVESFGHVPPYIVSRSSGNAVWINADHIQNYSGDARVEFTGILFHELTHVWQWNGNGMAPFGLLNGIADYVRLTAGWPAREWVKKGSGSRWDEGYAVTAYFLEYCTSLKGDFIAELNRMLKTGYNDSYFQMLLGKPVDKLWSDYRAMFGN